MRLVGELRRTSSRAIAVTLGAVVILVLAAPLPSAGQANEQAATGQSATPTATPVSNGAGVIDRVLVRVDGHAILYSDFEAQWQDQLGLISSQIPQDQIDAQAPALRLVMMKGMVEEAMIELRAEELGIVADVNDVDRSLAKIREDNGLQDDTAWVQALAQNGLNEQTMRENLAGQIVQQQMIFQEIQRQVFVSDREIVAYYENDPSQFSEPEQVLFQQLVFVYAGPDRAPVRERAENALTELRAGVSLTAVGNKYGTPQDLVQDAASASWLSPEDLQPEILATMNNLTPLDYSEIIEGRFGFHILQLMDRKDGRTLPLEEVGAYIKSLLTEQKMGTKLEEYTSELLTKASLEIYSEEFAELRNAWSEDAAATGTPGQQR